jgi:putative N6-adenine-specific DNA methylase
LLDPMCGGGTLLVEAAAIALDVAPGAGRSFGFEKLAAFDAALWQRVRSAQAPTRGRSPLSIFGSDRRSGQRSRSRARTSPPPASASA